MTVMSKRSHPKPRHFCGECKWFGNEDVYGVGSCVSPVGIGKFDMIRFCDDPCCEDFDLKEEE